MKNPWTRLIVVALVIMICGIVAGAWRIQWLMGPGGDGDLAFLAAPDGREYKLHQRHSGSWAEPYQINLYYRNPGEEWDNALYISHESPRWSSSEISINHSGAVEVFRNGDLHRTFAPSDFRWAEPPEEKSDPQD